MSIMSFELPKRELKSGVGFGDWFEQHQALTNASEIRSGGDASSNSNSSKLNTFLPSWAEQTNGLSLLPSFFSESAPRNDADAIIFGLSYAQRFKGFVVGLLLSALFFFLAFFVGLPTVVLRPHKFALCFTLGSLCFMASFAMLRGPSEHMSFLCRRERLPFSFLYIFSMLGTLYACLVMRSYILIIIFSFLQALSLLWFFCAMVPGGSGSMKYFVSAIVKTARYTVMPCMQGFIRGVTSCFKSLFRS